MTAIGGLIPFIIVEPAMLYIPLAIVVVGGLTSLAKIGLENDPLGVIMFQGK